MASFEGFSPSLRLLRETATRWEGKLGATARSPLQCFMLLLE